MSESMNAGVQGQDHRAGKVRVLLVDDQLIVVEAIRLMLAEQADIEFHFVTDASLAVETALQLQPTVILQDLVMRDPDGFTLIKEYRTIPTLRNVPVIVLSAKEEPTLKALSFEIGANDYLVKLPDTLELLARVRYHSGEYYGRLRRDESFHFLRESQRNLAEANIELHKLAEIDCLTGIANRRRFEEVITGEWQRCQRDKSPISLLLCDIDCFKNYNDRFGHLQGDAVLQRAAEVLTAQLRRPADLAARYGGEEFVVVLPNTDLEGAIAVGNACCSQMASLGIKNPGATRDGIITMSIGVATIVPSDETEIEMLIACADKAMYQAKEMGRNRVAVSDES